jgi:hypothetical protein
MDTVYTPPPFPRPRSSRSRGLRSSGFLRVWPGLVPPVWPLDPLLSLHAVVGVVARSIKIEMEREKDRHTRQRSSVRVCVCSIVLGKFWLRVFFWGLPNCPGTSEITDISVKFSFLWYYLLHGKPRLHSFHTQQWQWGGSMEETDGRLTPGMVGWVVVQKGSCPEELKIQDVKGDSGKDSSTAR